MERNFTVNNSYIVGKYVAMELNLPPVKHAKQYVIGGVAYSPVPVHGDDGVIVIEDSKKHDGETVKFVF